MLKIKKPEAFALVELLAELVIIGILVLLALPRLMSLISRAKSTKAQLHLGHLQTLEESFLSKIQVFDLYS